MAKLGFPEPSVGPSIKANCCGDVIQSLHRYRIDICACGRQSITGGADEQQLMRKLAASFSGTPEA